jgi:hypothetical protein
MRASSRTRGESRMFAILVGGLVLVVGTAVGFVLAFVDPIPTGLWIGLGVVAAVAVMLVAAAALLVFGSDRPSTAAAKRRPAVADRVRHVLVVANETVGTEALRSEVCARAAGCESEVLVVAPALNSPIRHWTGEEDAARAKASARLGEELAVLAGLGLQARGEVGADDPLQAIDDALRTFPADEIIISTHERERSNWLEEGVVERARTAYGLPVTHVVAGRVA